MIEGYQVQRFDLPNDLDHELKIILEFVGDKDGYRAKFTITQAEATESLRLNPSSLKSLSGWYIQLKNISLNKNKHNFAMKVTIVNLIFILSL